jgi:hypothetical protein
VVVTLALIARDAMLGGDPPTTRARKELKRGDGPPPERTPGQRVCLAVSGLQVGMTEDLKDDLVEPFFPTRETGGGTGLGLAQVCGIVR